SSLCTCALQSGTVPLRVSFTATKAAEIGSSKKERIMNKDQLIAWLNDAYAMEQALVPVLENHAKDVKDDPTARARIELHAEQTRRHAELVKGCIEQVGGSPSTLKSATAILFGTIHSVSTGMFADETVK